MKKSLKVVCAAALLSIVALVVGLRVSSVAAQGKKKAPTSHAAKKVIFAAADKADYKALPRASGTGVSMATIWGDPDKGPHGTFTKFEPGYDAGTHYHTNDTTIVVIKGAYLYKDEDGEKRVAAGDFLRVPGGHKHWSGGDKTEGALFYEEGSGKFDLIPVK